MSAAGAALGGGERPASPAFWTGLVIVAILVNATFETMLFPALPLIKADFHLTTVEVGWAFTAYSLAAAISLPVVGKLCDIYGPRRLLIGVIAALTIGVLLPVASRSFPALVIGQGLQGLGATLMPLGIALLSNARTGSEDVRSAGLITAGAISTAGGMVLAGVLLGVTGYRTLYWGAFTLNIVILLAACIVALRPGQRWSRVSGVVDWLGALLLGGGLVSLLLAVSMGGADGWLTPSVGALLTGSAVLFALFLVRSRSVAEPLISLALLRVRSFNRVAIIQLFSGFGAIATFVLVPLIVQSPEGAGGFGRNASTSGFALAPFGICCIFAPLIVSRLRALIGVPMVMVVGSLIAVAGPVLLIAAWNIAVVGFAMGILGFGIALLLTQSFDLVGTAAPAKSVASLSGLVFVLKMIGSALGGQTSTSLVGVEPSEAGFTVALMLAALGMVVSAVAAVSLLKGAKPE